MHETAPVMRLLQDQGAKLFRLLYRLTLRTDVAEDLLQELFLKLRDAPGFRGAHDPVAYAWQAALHLAYDWRRRQARHRTEPLPNAVAFDAPTPTDIERREEIELVLEALANLPESVQACLVLRHIEALDTDEIAARLGKTAHQVRALCSKGIGELRKRLRPAKEVAHDRPNA